MKSPLFRLSLALATASLVHAHFVFVVPQPGGSTAGVFISETLDPDGDVDIDLVKDAKLSLRGSNGNDAALTLAKSAKMFTVPVSGSGVRVIHGLADLGVSADRPYLLLYHPKTILGDAFDPKATLGSAAPVELVPTGKPGAVVLKLLAHGKPQADAEVTIILPDGKQTKVKTNASGETPAMAAVGRYGAWSRFFEPGKGTSGGKTYSEVRHYPTLVFDVPPAKSAAAFQKLPQASASLGAVESDGWLYVYGGHVSPTHDYSVESVSGRFDRMRLTGDPVWQELPGGPPMQGLNLAAHRGIIYRIGGMSPRNKKGEPSETFSLAECARFDPATKKWEDLPPMPEPRSSHDLAVIGDQLFVTGGWNLKGKGGQSWADTTLVMDLAAKPLAWRSIAQPFKRRALIAAAFENKVWVMGGIDDKGQIESAVSIYDPKSGQWSQGPKLPDGPVLGFSPAAVVHHGSLYISIADGSLLRLDPGASTWEKAGASTPRVAHRLASRGDTILVIGGAANGVNSDLIEAVPVKP